MQSEKYITRYGEEKGRSYTFRGWRLCITREGQRFVRYFSDKEYGGEEQSGQAARDFRDVVLAELQKKQAGARSVFAFFSKGGKYDELKAGQEKKARESLSNSLDLNSPIE